MHDRLVTIAPLPPAQNDPVVGDDTPAFDTPPLARDAVREKLSDAQTPGYEAEFDPHEAEAAGAFAEDAMSEADAQASTHDYPHFEPVAAPLK
jgi:hypothetical protein